VLLVVVATLGSYAIGLAAGVPLLVPFLNAALPWWLMAEALRAGQTTRAIAIMLVWALTMGVASTSMAALGWSRTRGDGDLFLRSAYRNEMIAWVRTGVGPESDPAAFAPRHVAYAGVFSVTAVATGGALAMPMGAALMNQMGEYVGAMAAASAHPFVSAVMGWHPWAVVRIAGFVIIGVVLSGPLLSRVRRFPFSIAAERRWLGAGAALLVLDLLLKWLLAPSWAVLLRGVAGW
jgi:hypothetical protein